MLQKLPPSTVGRLLGLIDYKRSLTLLRTHLGEVDYIRSDVLHSWSAYVYLTYDQLARLIRPEITRSCLTSPRVTTSSRHDVRIRNRSITLARCNQRVGNGAHTDIAQYSNLM